MSILTQAQKRAAILAGVEAREPVRKQTYAKWAAEEAASKPSETATNVRTKGSAHGTGSFPAKS